MPGKVLSTVSFHIVYYKFLFDLIFACSFFLYYFFTSMTDCFFLILAIILELFMLLIVKSYFYNK